VKTHKNSQDAFFIVAEESSEDPCEPLAFYHDSSEWEAWSLCGGTGGCEHCTLLLGGAEVEVESPAS